MPVSRGTGDGASVGVRVDAVVPFKEFYRAVAEASWSIEEKLYIGDGSGNTLRGKAELRAQWPGRGARVAPFVGVGLSLTKRYTSEYTKLAINPLLSAGVNVRDRFVPYVRWYLPEHNSPNRISAVEFGAELNLPLSEDTPWLIRGGISEKRTSFYQPFGPLAGNRHSWNLQLSLGAGYRF